MNKHLFLFWPRETLILQDRACVLKHSSLDCMCFVKISILYVKESDSLSLCAVWYLKQERRGGTGELDAPWDYLHKEKLVES